MLPSLLADAALLVESAPLPLATIAMGLFGGLALFLYGMDLMADALKLVAGEGMRRLLARLTANRFTSVLAGATVTAVIQSSSVTTVLLVGFISAGLMSLTQAVGVIMGANIGTTITAQIIAFKVTKYALALVALGFALQFAFKSERVRNHGHVIMGLGLIFFGMQLMSEGMRPLQFYAPFIEFMKNMESPLIGILFGALFTGLVQSSSATTGIVIVLASQGFLSLSAGIALIFGANIGTCATAVLAAIGKPREAKRAVLIHVMFNIAGVVLWFYFIPQLAQLVTALSPTSPELSGAARLAAEAPRQIANAHAVFNISNTMVFIGLAGPMAWLTMKLLPDKPEAADAATQPKYLDELLLGTPPLALDMVRLELGRLGAAVLRLTRRSLNTVIHGSRAELHALCDADTEIDRLHEAIVVYLGRLSQENLDERQSAKLHRYLSAANYFESIGDMIETNLVAAGLQRQDANLQISEATEEILNKFHTEICEAVDHAIKSLVKNDVGYAARVTGAKERIDELTARAEDHLSGRLAAVGEPNRLVAFRLESEILEYLKRMFYFAKRIAKIVTEDVHGATRERDEEDAGPEEAPIDAG